MNSQTLRYTAEDYAIADKIQSYWVNLTKNSDLNRGNLMYWTPSNNVTKNTMSLGGHFSTIKVRLDNVIGRSFFYSTEYLRRIRQYKSSGIDPPRLFPSNGQPDSECRGHHGKTGRDRLPVFGLAVVRFFFQYYIVRICPRAQRALRVWERHGQKGRSSAFSVHSG